MAATADGTVSTGEQLARRALHLEAALKETIEGSELMNRHYRQVLWTDLEAVRRRLAALAKATPPAVACIEQYRMKATTPPEAPRPDEDTQADGNEQAS